MTRLPTKPVCESTVSAMTTISFTPAFSPSGVGRSLLFSDPTTLSKAHLHEAISCMQASGLRGFTTYQPASHYWPFQGIETGIYLALAAAALAVTFAVVRRRDA